MLGRKSFLLFLSNIVVASLGYVGLYFLTNYYDETVYGTIIWTLSFVAIFNSITDMGFSSAHIKRISEGKDLSDCVSTYVVIKVALVIAMVIITLSSVFVWTSILGKTFEDISLDIILMFILYYALLDLSTIASHTFTARQEMAKLPLVTMTDPLVRVPLVAIGSVLTVSIIELSLAYLASAVAILTVASWLLLREKIKWKKPTLIRSYAMFTAPLVVLSLVGVANSYMDKLLLGVFYTESEVGIYSAPQAFLAVFAIIGTAVSTLTYPSFSKYHSEGKVEMIRKVTREAERYIMMISLPITLLIIMFPSEICTILIANFKDSADVIWIMAITNLLLMLNSVDSSQIIAVDRPDISMRITIITFVINIIGIILLVPDSSFLGFGLGMSFVGVALAILIGRTVSFIITRYVVWKLTGTTVNPRLGYQLIAGLVVVGVLLCLPQLFTITRWYSLVLYGLITLGVYIGTLVALREFTRKDFDYFLSILNLKEMFKYFKEELK